MTENNGNGAGSDGTPSASGSAPGANSLNALNKNNIVKFEKRLGQETLSPYGSDGSTINVGTENQVQSMTKLKRCNEIKSK